MTRWQMPLSSDEITGMYGRFAPRLRAYFEQRVGDAELAADLLAETFALAVAGADRYRGGAAHEASGWLWTIAHNVYVGEARRSGSDRRRERRLPTLRAALVDGEIERLEELAGSERLRAATRRRLRELPAEQREAIRLRVLEERSYAEVAARLAVTAALARTRVSRGLRTLHRQLSAEHELWRLLAEE